MEDVLERLKALYGGTILPAIRNKIRWKAPWPMVQGNTVNLVFNKDGSMMIYATGKAAEVTRHLIGAESSSKLIGTSDTKYSVWVTHPPEASPDQRDLP